MPLSYSRIPLSGSTDGKTIPVVATGTPGTTIHTALSGTSGFDDIYLWAANVTNVSSTLTIEWGGTSDPNDHMVHSVTIPANSPLIPISQGAMLRNSVVVRAFSMTGSSINIIGYVNRAS